MKAVFENGLILREKGYFWSAVGQFGSPPLLRETDLRISNGLRTE